MRRSKRALWIFDVGFARMNRQEWAGWMPIMGVFAGVGVCLFVGVLLGAKQVWAWALPIFSGINVLISRKLATHALRRAFRFGIYGPLRARWWIELAAVNLLLVFCLFLFAVSNGAGAALPPWQKAIADFAFRATRVLGPPFLLLTVAGYIIGLAGNQRVTGRSLEMVNFIFWMLAGIAASSQLPPVAEWIAPAIGVVGGAALLLAGGMAVVEKWKLGQRNLHFPDKGHRRSRST